MRCQLNYKLFFSFLGSGNTLPKDSRELYERYSSYLDATDADDIQELCHEERRQQVHECRAWQVA